MKRHIIYLITIAATLLVGCKIDYSIPAPDMVDEGEIKVTFSVNGKEVRSLDLASISHTIVVEVDVNEENIFWTPVSSQEWCTILEKEHRGSDSFTVVINANNSFEPREDAVISFVASKYTRPMLRISHNGNVFVLDEEYAVSTKTANSRQITVKTPAGTNWNFSSDDWITVVRGEETTSGDRTITSTNVTISWKENTGASRYGAVSLSREGDEASGWFSIWQYGTDVNYDDEGYLLLSAQDALPLELRVPVHTVKDITLPVWMTYEEIYREDRTVSYMLACEDNPSDARYVRSAQLVLSMLSGASDLILPTFKQDYYSVKGLRTARGLTLLSKTWNEGGDISQWMIDEDVAIVEDIDFNEIPEYEWVAIGTPERPWTMGFNGNGKKIYNLHASQPLFGHCSDGASIRNVFIDSSSSFEAEEPEGTELNISSFAYEITGTVLENCKNSAAITLNAADDTHSISYVGGLVCKMDQTSYIKNSSNVGNISITQVNSALTLGGLVGQVGGGHVESSSNSGNISFASQVYIPRKELYVGGIVGNVSDVTGIVLNCSNGGSISTAGSNIGATIYTGGIAGLCAGTVSGCSNSTKGMITTSLMANTHYVGGVVGAVGNDEGLLITDNSNGGSITYNTATTRTNDDEGRIFAIGGVVGYTAGTAGAIKENTNNASVSTASSARFVYVGGVLGWMGSPITGMFKDNSVGSNVIVNATGKGRTIGVGGLVGMLSNGSIIDLADDKGTVKCTVKGGNCEGSKYTVGIGGIAGAANGVATIRNVSIWQGTLYVDSSVTNSNCTGFGGIIGSATNDLTIENCTSNGSLISNMKTALNGKMAIGGIVGIFNKEDGACKISGCTNHSDLSFGSTATKANYKPVHMAGIIGLGVQGNVEISDCHNRHGFYNQSQNGLVIKLDDLTTMPKATYTAGIIAAYGLDVINLNLTENGTLTITDCTNDSSESQNHADYKDMIRNHRGAVAGIAGYVRDASITKCTNYGPLIRTNGGPAGGIVAIAKNSSIKDCTATCTATPATGGGFIAHSAGIASVLLEECIVDGCSFYGDINTAVNTNASAYMGGICGYTSDDTQIRNCKFGGSVNDVTITKDNYLANIAHLSDNSDGKAVGSNATVKDCSYWNGN